MTPQSAPSSSLSKQEVQASTLDTTLHNYNLTPEQEKTVKKIAKIMDASPEVSTQISSHFIEKFSDITHNPETLDALIDTIQSAMKGKLQDIITQFESGKMSKEVARQQSLDTIHYHTKLKVASIQNSLQTPTTNIA